MTCNTHLVEGGGPPSANRHGRWTQSTPSTENCCQEHKQQKGTWRIGADVRALSMQYLGSRRG
eukprot:363074-Chlamydomonas_euryale.AAC.6